MLTTFLRGAIIFAGLTLSVATYQAQIKRSTPSPLPPSSPHQTITTQTAVTEDGRKVILKSNGTWEYAPAPASSAPAETAERAARRKLIKSLKEVETDQSKFIGKEFVINGTLKLSGFYNHGYQDAQATHYAFDLTDNSGSHAYVYLKRSSAYAPLLRQPLLQPQVDMLKTACLVTILPARAESTLAVFAELISCEPPF